MTHKVPFLNRRLKRAFAEIARDAQGEDTSPLADVFIAPIIPECILRKIKEQFEKKTVTLPRVQARS